MARIERGHPEAADRFTDWPKSDWPRLLSVKRDFLATRLTYDCRCLQEFVDEAQIVWRDLGFNSLDDMIQRGLELEPAEINAAYQWLQANEPDSAVSLATVLERELAADQAQRRGRGGPNNPHGRAGKPETRINVSNIHIDSVRPAGTTRRRALRCLDTPAHQDLLAHVLAGELTPHAAMLRAGLRRPTATIYTDRVESAVRTLLKHFTRAQLLEALQTVEVARAQG